jgi:hypothetical protein
MDDDLTRSLLSLAGDFPKPRLNLSNAEKAKLVERLGPRTTRSILKAKKDFSLSRIPFLFSTLDTQDVVDVLNNDMSEVLKETI